MSYTYRLRSSRALRLSRSYRWCDVIMQPQLWCTENNVTSGHRTGIPPHDISYLRFYGYVIFLSVIVIILQNLCALSLSLWGSRCFSIALLIALRAYSNWIVCGWNRELLTFCHVCLSLLSLALLALQCSLAMNTSGVVSRRIDDFIEIFLSPVSLSQLGLVVPLAINANLQHLEFTRDFSWESPSLSDIWKCV